VEIAGSNPAGGTQCSYPSPAAVARRSERRSDELTTGQSAPASSFPAGRMSTFGFARRVTREVMVGNVGVGGMNPIRVQSMTTTDTLDTAATVAQALRLVATGCEIVRITAPTVEDARNLGRIRDALRATNCVAPLVADIHFSPAAALEAAKHVEKVRINPGNFADSKRFAVREYSDSEYDAELARIAERFGPLVDACKGGGVAMRIGTNHGSLSDRIMNRFGDTPRGMVESAVEFAGICRNHGYHDVIFSMKSSNPKVMVQAYRQLAARLDELGWDYPFHLGVTEAGNGQDGRIKSAIGIGALLDDGIGDTIRVSLTEDPEAEIPVAFALARRFGERSSVAVVLDVDDARDVDQYVRHRTRTIAVGNLFMGGGSSPAVILDLEHAALASGKSSMMVDVPAVTAHDLVRRVGTIAGADPEAGPRVDGIAVGVMTAEDVQMLGAIKHVIDASSVDGRANVVLIAGLGEGVPVAEAARHAHAIAIDVSQPVEGARWSELAGARLPVMLEVRVGAIPDVPAAVVAWKRSVREAADAGIRDMAVVVTTGDEGAMVRMARAIRGAIPYDCPPIWLRHISDEAPDDLLLSASIGLGAPLCDGTGDAVSVGGVEVLGDGARTRLGFDILQGASARITKTEYVACPSCGRTLFDLQETTTRIQARTAHLKGVKLAIMGCIVNGPGEMADADFGYVGGAPGKVNLYVGRECIEKGVAQSEADDRLIDLIRRHGRWVDPPPASNGQPVRPETHAPEH
jgi:(E)-4-hydroxy-3-methylbut-2-enyl-diphosphate synthase